MTEARDIEDKTDFSPGSHGCHEALHMASFLVDAIDGEIVSHPAIEAVPEWKEIAQRALNAMEELYWKIAERHI